MKKVAIKVVKEVKVDGRKNNTGRNDGKALKDIPVALQEKKYYEFRDMVLKISQEKKKVFM